MTDMIRAILLLLMTFGISVPAGATVYTLSTTDQGWYSNAGAHNPANMNTITGVFGASEYRGWFKFNIPAECADGVQSAEFIINSTAPSAGSGPVPHSLTLNDITQANVDDLGVLTSSVALFNDIGNGSIGSFSVTGNGNFSATTAVNALAAIKAAAGAGTQAYALGLALQPNAGTDWIMGYSGPVSVVATLTIDCTQDPTLTLNKTLVNDSGGSASTSDFTPFVDGVATTWGTVMTLAPGSYTVSESTLTGYGAGGWGGDCASDGTITLSAAQTATCTITNNDLGVDLNISKLSSNASPSVGDDVTFTLLVSNSGPDPATNVSIADVLPPGFAYQAGSINGGDVRDDSDPTGAGLQWTIATLAVGPAVSLTYIARILSP